MPETNNFQKKNDTVNIALVGNPNSGKSVIFNRLTGSNQKIANYAGVTVERKEGFLHYKNDSFKIIDLPGTYSLKTLSPDEAITQEILQGLHQDDIKIDIVVFVVDINNIKRNLQLFFDIKALGYPIILVLNMIDIARKRGLEIDSLLLAKKLGIQVIETVATQSKGLPELIAAINEESLLLKKHSSIDKSVAANFSIEQLSQAFNASIQSHSSSFVLEDKIDAIVLHPIWGYFILASILFGMFQAVYSWSELPMEWIETSIEFTGEFIGNFFSDGVLKSLLIEGLLSGVGSVIVFLPQILILFLFLLVLEESGYLPRAAFLLDRLMRSVGLSGRSFIPLLSCFACAVPGILATRTIHDSRSRIATIMIAPLITCSARLPVYLLVIGAFIPNEHFLIFNLQGLVLFALYMSGIISAMIVGFIIKVFIQKNQYQPLIMELPAYHLPNPTHLLIALWEKAKIFITHAGTIIFALMVLLWFCSNFPGAPENATEPAIRYSIAGQLGYFLQYIFEPIGFNWQLSIALIPGMAAREASVAALGTVYALSGGEDELSIALSSVIATTWGLPSALSLLAWYIFAPQCLPMIIATKQETHSWKYALIMVFYLFSLAYIASFIVFQISTFLVGGK